MKEFYADFSKDPSFDSVLGLSNTTFDPNNIVGGQMATEAQIRELWEQISQLESRIDYCCRDIVVWRSYVRVIAEDTGIVISDWLDNMNNGTARRGVPFTVEFALPHDSNRYFDNRSRVETVDYQTTYNTSFNVKASVPGKVSQLETEFYQNAVGQARDGVASASGTQIAKSFGNDSALSGWPAVPNGSAVPSDGIRAYSLWIGNQPYPLPQLSSTQLNINETLLGYYYVYKDVDNKIKIDVRRRDQYADNEHLALFFTQFVLRKELV